MDIRIEGNGHDSFHGAIGFRKTNEGTYEAVGDFYGLSTADGRSLSANSFKNEVTAGSKEIEIGDRLGSMDFHLTDGSRTDTKEYVDLVFERWVN